jgi:ABC-type nitrate/sulfonate/bicarbonate transport system substrate-binding protein
MKYSRRLHIGLVVLCLAGGAAACSESSSAARPDTSNCQPPNQKVPLTLGVNPGAQDMVTFVMQNQKFAEKRNLQLDVKEFQNPAALHAAIGQHTVDIGFGGVTAMAVARAQGRGIMGFDILTSPSNIVVARKDSSLNTFADIKGHKLGAFGGRGSATFAIASIVAKEKYSVNSLGGEAEVIEAPDAAVLGLLDEGNIDAALIGTTATVQALLSGKYKELSDISGDYQAAIGSPPGHVTVASNDEFAKQNCGALKAFSEALDDTVEYIRTDDQVWADYAKKIQLTDPKAPAMLKERVGSRYIATWDQKQADAEADLVQRLIPVLGAENFVAKVPDGLFRVGLEPNAR